MVEIHRRVRGESRETFVHKFPPKISVSHFLSHLHLTFAAKGEEKKKKKKEK